MASHKIYTYAEFKVFALLGLAEKLRRKPCSCDISKIPLCDGHNWTVVITFHDGIEWMFRSPRKLHRGISQKYAGLLLSSEAATLKYIKANTALPVPEVFDYSPSSENEIGVPYILMSKPQGTLLSDYDWPGLTAVTAHQLSVTKPRPLTDVGKEKIMRQLGELMHELSRLRLDKIGSLFEEDTGDYVVKQCLAPGFVQRGRDSVDIDRGPLDGETAYYEALASAARIHAQMLPMEAHMFSAPTPIPSEFPNLTSYLTASDRWTDFTKVGGKIDSGKNRMDYCIASDLAKEMIPRFNRHAVSGGFPIRHPDLSVDNIFVDDDLNITCIADWGFASSVPFAELLAAPGMQHPRGPTSPSLAADFRAGFEGKGGRHEPRLWEDAEMIWHFQRLVFMDSLQEYHHFKELYNLAYQPSRPVDIAALIRQQYACESNQKELAFLSGKDKCVSHVKREEREYFSSPQNVGTNREAVARKLDVMTELNPAMVVDRRLWHWLARVFDEDTLSGVE